MAEELFIVPEKLGSFFKDALSNPKNVFVFSTDVVMNSWVDWCVTHPDESGVEAVPLERFIAWDKFKGEAVRGTEHDKKSIPSILRKFFVNSLIAQNASATDENVLFKKLINPEFRADAASFSDWIARLLPSLKLWHETIKKHPEYKQDDEDSDYMELYNRYSAFLDANNFFEPSWIVPDFSSDGKHYILFYPETLEDYADYIDVFATCPDITIVSLPKTDSKTSDIPCIKYFDSRKELRRTILQIRKLCTGNTSSFRWDQITLNVPDLPTYRPYLERELTKYCVPFVIRAGFPLIQNTAGQVFTEIQNCFNSEFSYDSMRSLLLDEYIPWKTDLKILRENLIQEGNKMRCICGFDEPGPDSIHFDSWEEALSSTANQNTLELNFYRNLKHDISSICKSNSFDAIIQAWEIFKEHYLEKNDFSEAANAILGRCITELKNLAQIENDYCNAGNSELKVSNHYDFFINELGKKTYAPQSKKTGISVYPYKLSAGAFFQNQFVIDSSQDNLEIQYKKLGFLSQEKRRLLGLQNQDKTFNASKAFIRLYAAHFPDKTQCEPDTNDKIIRFSYAEDTFAGFAICHNALNQIEVNMEYLDDDDFILNEKKYMMGMTLSSPLKLSKAQKTQIENFHAFNTPTEPEAAQNEVSSIVFDKVNYALKKDRDGKIVITQTDMNKFFPCPRKWIFSKVLSLKEESLDTDLMKNFDMGNINHKILELFMNDYYESQEPLPTCNDDDVFENEDKIVEVLKKYALTAIHDSSKDYSKSPLSQKMLGAQIDQITANILSFLHSFLKPNRPSGPNINKKTRTEGYGGCLVRGVEKPYSVKSQDKNYNYYGKIDLILTSSEQNTDADGWTIIDYKESSKPEAHDIKVNNDKLGNFQMPMYISLIQANEKVKDIDVARFYTVKGTETTVAIDRNTQDFSQEDFEPTMEAFRNYSDDFERIVSSKVFEPDPDKVDIYEDCFKCNFKSVCRRNYEVSKRR
ncbi:MAG: PD-(D/E)XK nuclease family protein [Spirochaetaceae bacterium]|nr:PD-(D/E)XK nuclease family protein [Spirochaetaceae bacterium]